MTIRILLVDDHHLVRQGLRALIERRPDLEVVGEADDGRSAIQMVRELAPDLAVMDLRMPDLNGIDATRQALAEKPDLKVVGLSAQSDESGVREMLRVGASGYLLKDAVFEELVNAIYAVMDDKIYLSPTISRSVLNHAACSEERELDSVFTVLSGREREVLQLFSEGMSTKEIAAHLQLSTKTIETHRRNIMAKTSASGIAELTRYAIRQGITPL
jgi:DNA-binding NarL/FixJ family response regulator